MISCPKCDTSLGDGARKCPFCGTPLSLRAFRPDPDRKPDPVVDPLLELFDRDEVVRFCPDCRNEFRTDMNRCRRCGLPLERDLRSRYERDLIGRPLRNTGTDVARGPRDVPPDLVRIKIARGLEEATLCLRELRFVGLEPHAGSDSLDPFDEPESIGIYVRAPDRDAARYLVDGLQPEDPLLLPPEVASDPRGVILDRARGYLELGKYRDVRRILEPLGDDGEVLRLRAETLLRSGRVRSAQRETLASADHGALDLVMRGRLRAQGALMSALGNDGTPFGKGADLQLADVLLRQASREAPRVLDVGKILVEVLVHLRDREAMEDELRRLDRLNPNLQSRDGYWRELREARQGDFPSR